MLVTSKKLDIVVIELPLTWLYTKNSRLTLFRDLLRIFVELIKVKLNSRKNLL